MYDTINTYMYMAQHTIYGVHTTLAHFIVYYCAYTIGQNVKITM
jgi:hypothetical protein